MAKNTCHPVTIYDSKTVTLQYCSDCKTVHLNLGDLTIRMNESQFSQFSQDMSNGVFEFRANMEGRSSLRMLM